MSAHIPWLDFCLMYPCPKAFSNCQLFLLLVCLSFPIWHSFLKFLGIQFPMSGLGVQEAVLVNWGDGSATHVEQRDSEGLVSKENEAGTRKGRGTPSEPICAGGNVQVVVLAEWGDRNATNVEQRRMGGGGQQGKRSG